MDDTDRLDALSRAVEALVDATNPPLVFRRLLEASRLGAPRSAILMRRGAGWKGWGGSGLDASRISEVRGWSAGGGDGWTAILAEVTAGCRLPHDGPPWPLPDCDERWGVPVRVGGRVIAALVAGRLAGETPWSPVSLAILASVGRARLELELALRRSAGSARTSTPDPEPRTSPSSAGATLRERDGEDPASAIAPWQSAGTESGGRGRRIEEARRYARLVATDIRLYNESAVVLGRQNGDLADRLCDQLERGRESFNRRFPELGDEGSSLLQDAYVQVLAGGDPALIP